MATEVDTRPVNTGNLADLAALFGSQRSTRHCWCTAFCISGARFAAGWFGGGNRRRFESIATTSEQPMGVLASIDGSPVGWGACGPRSRYTGAIDGRSGLLQSRPRDEDDRVWLIPCLFVRASHRGRGITRALMRAAVDLSREQGARAVEGWPLARSATAAADAFLGREEAFEAAGFRCIDRPSRQRVIMRLDLDLDVV